MSDNIRPMSGRAGSLARDGAVPRCTSCNAPLFDDMGDQGSVSSLASAHRMLATALDWCELALDELTGFRGSDEEADPGERQTVMPQAVHDALMDRAWSVAGFLPQVVRLAMDGVARVEDLWRSVAREGG